MIGTKSLDTCNDLSQDLCRFLATLQDLRPDVLKVARKSAMAVLFASQPSSRRPFACPVTNSPDKNDQHGCAQSDPEQACN